MLSVTCASDGSAPAGASFCLALPVVTSIGGGRYRVTYTPGTIWWGGMRVPLGDVLCE